MKCYVFSIGEKTTQLCCELMSEYGYEVVLYQDGSTLWDKLKRFYTEALQTEDKTFIRIDADVIPNKNVHKLEMHHLTETVLQWTCASGFDWYKQDRGPISIHFMDRRIIQECLEHIEEAKHKIRPETYLWRLPKVNQYTSIFDKFNCGIHGYGQQIHRNRIKQLKYLRNQDYDWDLLERIEAL